MTQPRWLSAALVAAIHDEALYEFGGLPGVRDAGLLESAIDRPRNRLAYEPGSSPFELAAALCVGLAKNHPFIDGNKRTALLATHAFLLINGYALEPQEEDEVLTLIAVADGSLTEAGLAAWLRANAARRGG
ncbi:MAG TPA: type II toxin-antitoxin system death-on-curing family toxin [Steroidobacteraceae bacterium]|nr:type II toxin-antitoxin system death-on-curing family toxin [Gammaproteobacteria bacterium]HEV2284468.1 type II toxin-antitoxin system death-on-curing family toxin [Steroidobacteraceae bacterium]